MSCWCKQQGLQGGCATKFDYSVLRPEDFSDGNIIVIERDHKIDPADYAELARAITVYAEEVHGEPQRLFFFVLKDKEGVAALDSNERAALLSALSQDLAERIRPALDKLVGKTVGELTSALTGRCEWCDSSTPHANNQECTL